MPRLCNSGRHCVLSGRQSQALRRLHGDADPVHTAEIEDYLSEYFSSPPLDRPLPFDRDDFVSSICQLNRCRAPCTQSDLCCSPSESLTEAGDTVLELFNFCLRLRYFPRVWKTTNIVMIPKSNKPRMLPEIYGPISFLLVTSKVCERLLHSRMSPRFRKEHSTTPQLVCVIRQLSNAANIKLSTGIV